MKALSRRSFMKNTGAAGAVLGFPTIIPASALGKGEDGKLPPSERVNVGLISCGTRSRFAESYLDYGKAQIVALCDPIKETRMKKMEKCGKCDDYSDFRDVLARKDIDAVHIATPDHWHVPISMAAAKAGKAMYTEKPLGISIDQDLRSKAIVDKYNCIFQYGTQHRSSMYIRMGIELVLNGHIGDLEEIIVWCPKGESGGSAAPVIDVPKGFDFDMWLGPAPKTPFCKDRCQVRGTRNGIFHIYDYAIGFIAGWGAHSMDQTQWWADAAGLDIPVKYKGTGTIPTEGLFNTLTHWNMTCTYKSGLEMRFVDSKTLETLNIPELEEVKSGNGTLFKGSKGWVVVYRGGWNASSRKLLRKAKKPGKIRLPVSIHQAESFVDAVIAKKQPVSNLHSAIRSDIICHLSDIAIRTGREITWDPKKETIVGDDEAIKMMSRPMRAPWDKLMLT